MSNKTRIVHASRLFSLLLPVRRFTHRIWQDRVSVYAAQASFFTIISSVPLISLLANIVRLIWPTSAEREKVIDFFSGTVPESILELAIHSGTGSPFIRRSCRCPSRTGAFHFRRVHLVECGQGSRRHPGRGTDRI